IVEAEYRNVENVTFLNYPFLESVIDRGLSCNNCTLLKISTRIYRNQIKKYSRKEKTQEKGKNLFPVEQIPNQNIGPDSPSSGTAYIEDENKIFSSNTTKIETSVIVPSRNDVLRACTVTCGLVGSLGVLIRQELLFRGALLPIFGINWTNILAVAALFCILHLGGGRNYSFAIWPTFVGLVYGYATILTSSATVPMPSHALNNLYHLAISESVGRRIWLTPPFRHSIMHKSLLFFLLLLQHTENASSLRAMLQISTRLIRIC
ncbi:uncharacterized protein, partial [Primulina huaijiensis]|uniref:uncharacterized protein n=1 Tax=Primulina huaijiensis TaxID=1492673 RepID=UPI003CC76C85